MSVGPSIRPASHPAAQPPSGGFSEQCRHSASLAPPSFFRSRRAHGRWARRRHRLQPGRSAYHRGELRRGVSHEGGPRHAEVALGRQQPGHRLRAREMRVVVQRDDGERQVVGRVVADQDALRVVRAQARLVHDDRKDENLAPALHVRERDDRVFGKILARAERLPVLATLRWVERLLKDRGDVPLTRPVEDQLDRLVPALSVCVIEARVERRAGARMLVVHDLAHAKAILHRVLTKKAVDSRAVGEEQVHLVRAVACRQVDRRVERALHLLRKRRVVRRQVDDVGRRAVLVLQ
mmetsp:Transcript_1496/g.4902  ORF Transcript_1496/g.4902 Transcript_1496/m.4902 type:complete len:294 (-) Transcript_1496:126-1007(-)